MQIEQFKSTSLVPSTGESLLQQLRLTRFYPACRLGGVLDFIGQLRPKHRKSTIFKIKVNLGNDKFIMEIRCNIIFKIIFIYST